MPKIWRLFSSTERRIFGAALIAFLISLIFLSTNFYYEKTIERPASGGHYTEGSVGQPIFINPLLALTNEIDRDLVEIIYSNLIELTESQQLGSNNRFWTITLKPNLQWADGQPLTADDVVFTIAVIQNSADHPSSAVWQGVTAEKINDNEVRLSLKTPYVFFSDHLQELKIAPKHIFGSIPPANLRLSRYNLEPVGSGAYQFAGLKIEKDGFITDYQLARNPAYHGPPPYLDKVNFKFYRRPEELIDVFNKKEIDGLGGLDQKLTNQLKVGRQIISIALPRYYAIFFNPLTNKALKDKRVRTALDLATNKEQLAKQIFNNQTVLVNGPLPPNIEGYDRAVYQTAGFDLKAAVTLLDASGWTSGKDGVRIKLDIIVPQVAFLVETVNLIKEDWQKVGVELNPLIVNSSEINEAIKTRGYQLLIFGNSLKKSPDVFSFWHSLEKSHPGRNLALYENKNVDRLLEAIRQDFNNHSRQQKLTELQRKIYEDRPAIFLFSPNYLYVLSRNLRGFSSYFITAPAERFNKIDQWHLKTNRVLN